MTTQYASSGSHLRRTIAFAVPIVALILGLFTYWFGFANRAVVFLYGHDMGPRGPATGPFSLVTRSRYWMAGLVATGAVMVLYTCANWLLGRILRQYEAPTWSRIWTACAGPLAVGIPMIVMTLGRPTLPLGLATLTMTATLAGLALALLPGAWAARRPWNLVWLGLDGASLALWLNGVAHLDEVMSALGRGDSRWAWLLGVELITGTVGLACVTGVHRLWRRRSVSRATSLYLAALSWTYVLLPLVHHVSGTNGYFYITDMDNFFSRNPWTQGLAFVITAALAWTVASVRRRWVHK